MRRREFVRLLLGSAAAWSYPVWAQQPGTYRIGLLDYSPAEAGRVRLWEAFRQQLRDTGYGEGHNVLFEPRWADGQADRLPALAKELVDLRVDLIVTAGTPAVVAAQHVTPSIPIVMATGGDPVAVGVVDSLARPGRNVTGVSTLTSQLSAKRFELFREIIPQGSRFGAIWDTAHQAAMLALRETQEAARLLGIAVDAVGVRRAGEFEGALASLAHGAVVPVMVISSPLFYAARTRIAELAISNRLATMTPERDYAEAGGLLSYGSDFAIGFRCAAYFADKILRGAKPADLPIEQPTKFELIINLRTAKAIGLTIPESFLLRADEVIE
jgi:putative ABC transport system substrate-binding protein